jgi:hypothetical protein
MRGWTGAVAAALTGVTLTALLARPADAASSSVCSSSSHSALAARLSRDIAAARHGRVSAIAVEVDDPGIRLVCRLNTSWHFDSASVVINRDLNPRAASRVPLSGLSPSWGTPDEQIPAWP